MELILRMSFFGLSDENIVLQGACLKELANAEIIPFGCYHKG